MDEQTKKTRYLKMELNEKLDKLFSMIGNHSLQHLSTLYESPKITYVPRVTSDPSSKSVESKFAIYDSVKNGTSHMFTSHVMGSFMHQQPYLEHMLILLEGLNMLEHVIIVFINVTVDMLQAIMG